MTMVNRLIEGNTTLTQQLLNGTHIDPKSLNQNKWLRAIHNILEIIKPQIDHLGVFKELDESLSSIHAKNICSSLKDDEFNHKTRVWTAACIRYKLSNAIADSSVLLLTKDLKFIRWDYTVQYKSDNTRECLGSNFRAVDEEGLCCLLKDDPCIGAQMVDRIYLLLGSEISKRQERIKNLQTVFNRIEKIHERIEY